MKKLMFVVLFLAAVGCVQAQNVYQWFGPVSSNWTDGGNWMTEIGPDPTGTFGIVPDATAKVKLNNVLWGGIQSPVIGGVNGTQAISIGDVFMVDAGHLTPESLTVGVGGTLLVQGAIPGTSEGQINIAYAPLGTASLIMDGGIADVLGPVHVGWGGTGSLILNSGILTVNAITVGGAGGSGSIAITEGILRINGFATGQMQALADDGRLTGYGSPDNVVISYDPDTMVTTVTAVPEPITLSLLSLGALLLRKRS